MTRDTKYQSFFRALILLSKIFSKEIDEQIIQTYWYVLKDYSEKEIRQAFNRAIRECKFFPPPAQLIEFIEGNQKIKAEQA
jgi:hypothetical protein